MNQKIPCTVAILTHNSATTLRRALQSVALFDEIIISDGNSTDATRSIAEEYGARILTQDASFLQSGRIRNFAGVRNQTLDAANHDWFFFLDSDEFLGQALVEEISLVVEKNIPTAYWVPRKYVYNESSIDNAVTYPTQQIRFFNRRVATRFVKEVHERINLTVTPEKLSQAMFVPVPTVSEMKAKWKHYLIIERGRLRGHSLHKRVKLSLRELAIGGLYLSRLLRIFLFSKGTHLPFAYEWARVMYQLQLVGTMFGW